MVGVGSAVLSLVVLCVAHVHAQSYNQEFTSLGSGTQMFRMGNQQGSFCEPGRNTEGTIECNGGIERAFSHGVAATNAIPQVVNVTMRYEGSLPAFAYISLIDSASTCSSYPHPTAPDNLHSGVQQANEHKVVTIPQQSANGDEALLTSTKEGQQLQFRMCYSCDDSAHPGRCSNTTFHWADTGIQLHISRVDSIIAYSIAHKTTGTIPSHSNLRITYTGPLMQERWLSFVDETLNNGFPCGSGLHTAGAADSSHSGSKGALPGSKSFTFDSAGLSAAKTFAVCYAESGGITSSQWRDSGIRVKKAAITAADYGVGPQFGAGYERRTWNRYTDRVNPAVADISTDKLPRVGNVTIQLVGDLSLASGGVKVALVDATLMSGKPCSYAALPGANPATFHYKGESASNPVSSTGTAYGPGRRHFSGMSVADTSGLVTLLQAGGDEVLMDHDDGVPGTRGTAHVYALCYTMGVGTNTDTGWSDSYLRYELSDIESIQHHQVLHTTTGQLPRSTASGTVEGPGDVVMRYGASDDEPGSVQIGYAPPAGGFRSTNGLVFVQDTTYTPANQQADDVCGGLASSIPSAGEYSSGLIQPAMSSREFSLDTSDLHTGVIDQATGALTKTYFAVCYTADRANTPAHWYDSGIRVTVSKIHRIDYGNVHGATNYAQSSLYEQRRMYPHWNSITSGPSPPPTNPYESWDGTKYVMDWSTGQARAHNVISQSPNQVLTYSTSGPLDQQLRNGSWVSLVDATLNGGTDTTGQHWAKPCEYREASKSADSSHSGVMQAGSGDSLVTLLQSIPLSETKVFAVCYAVVSGTTADTTWDDSYVRVTVSMVSSITSIGVVHEVYNDDKYVATIANRGSEQLDLTYSGTLIAGASLSLVDESLSTDGTTFACRDNGARSAGGDASGQLDAPGNSATVLVQTSTLFHNITFAVCYKHSTISWQDTGIRLRRSEFSSVRFANLYAAPAPRDQTSIPHPTNRLWRKENMQLTYVADPAPALPTTGYSPTLNGRVLSIVAVDDSVNGRNPCTAGLFTALKGSPALSADGGPVGQRIVSGRMKASSDSSAACTSLYTTADAKECGNFAVTQSTDDEMLDASKSFAVCYCNDCIDNDSDSTKLWYDSYIRFDITKVATLSQSIGKWGSAAGLTIEHHSSGQLPNMSPNTEWSGESFEGPANENLELTYVGTSLASTVYFSLVDHTINQHTTHSITYNNPCGNTALWTGGTISTGPVTGTGSVTTGTLSDLDTSGLDALKIYAFCYSEDGTSYTDSGMRYTVPEVVNVMHDSIHYGVSPRAQTARFRPQNRIPVANDADVPYPVLKYEGPSSTSAGATFHFQLIEVKSTQVNPCVTESSLTVVSASATNTGPLTAAAHHFTVTTPTPLAHEGGTNTGVFAVCYSSGSNAADGRATTQVVQSDGITPDTTNGVTYQNTFWKDTYIRLQTSLIASLNVANLITTTDGTIPNAHAGMRFQYFGWDASGNLLTKDKYISFVHDKAHIVGGSYEPCSDSSSAISNRPNTHTGRLASANSQSYVNTLDTTQLWTNITFALCYSTANDGSSGWYDSGIRVSTPKIFSIEASSGYTGGSDSCEFHGGDPTFGSSAYSGICKRDTMARQQTSKPLSTNRLALDASSAENLRFLGTLPAGSTITIVRDTVSPNSQSFASGNTAFSGVYQGTAPCSDPSAGHVTAGSPSSDSSGAMVSDASNSFTVPSNALFPEQSTVAVCYYDPAATTPSKWRDSLIRLVVSQMARLDITIPKLMIGTMNGGSENVTVTVKTVGQIPRQKPLRQVKYSYRGGLSAQSNYAVALVEDLQEPNQAAMAAIADGGAALLTFTKDNSAASLGYPIDKPCETYDETRSTSKQMFGATSGFVLGGLDSHDEQGYANALKSNDGSNTPTLYAVCYNSTQYGWTDSGMRLTISEIESFHYQDDLATRLLAAGPAVGSGRFQVAMDHTTIMDSTYTATNQLPQLASAARRGTIITYGRWYQDGTVADQVYSNLPDDKYVSIVAAHLNSNNPCVDPAQAAHAPSSMHSGPILASGKAVNLTRVENTANQLDSSLLYAACYSNSIAGDKGQTTDIEWRDSYVRVTVTQLESLVSYQVTHQTIGGQIPNNPELKLDYVGSLGEGAVISLVDDQDPGAEIPWMSQGSVKYYYPCATASLGTSVSSTLSGRSTPGNASSGISNSHTVTLNTTALDVTKRYAVCHRSSSNTGPFHDSGIRVTLPSIYKFVYNSGYWSAADSAGTPNRDMVSFSQTDGYTLVDTPTNRIPQTDSREIGLSYATGVHTTANTSAGANNVNGDETISIVKATLNLGDPCTDPCTTGASCSSGTETSQNAQVLAHFGDTTRAPYLKTVQSHQAVLSSTTGNLLGDSTPDEVYAVCYTTGAATGNDRYWRDTYVRVKMTMVASLTVAGVRHFTDGHIPATAGKDGMKFHYGTDSTLPQGSAISLVDSTLGDGQPCAGTVGGNPLPRIGSEVAVQENWYKIDGALSSSFVEGKIKLWTYRATHTGPHKAGSSYQYVDGVDTRYLNTDAKFAVCYSSSRTASDWYDSGIRVSVSKVSGMEMSPIRTSSYNQYYAEYRCDYVNPADANVQNTCGASFSDSCTTRAICDPELPYNGGCGTSGRCIRKTDIAPRLITSATLAQNRIPSTKDTIFRMLGSISPGSRFSLVKFNMRPADVNVNNANNLNYDAPADPAAAGGAYEGEGNACVYSSLAAADPTDSDPINGVTLPDQRVYTGMMTSDVNGDITVPQAYDPTAGPALHNRLDPSAGFMYAVCYNDQGGAAYSWRDSYLRVKVSRLSEVSVTVRTMTPGSSSATSQEATTNIRTTGQLPNQPPQGGTQQVTFNFYAGLTQQFSTGAPGKVALVVLGDLSGTETDTDAHTSVNWGMSYRDPCNLQSPLVNAPSQLDSFSGTINLGTHQATTDASYKSTAQVLDLSSLRSDRTFAVCFTDETTIGANDYVDSGIRVHVPLMTHMDYKDVNGDPNRIERTRVMSSWVRATNVLPQQNGVQLTYYNPTDTTYALPSGGWVSVVDAHAYTSEEWSPCHDWRVTELSSATTSGATQAPYQPCYSDSDCVAVHNTSRCLRIDDQQPCSGAGCTCTGGVVNIPQNVLLSYDKVYAVCYAKSTPGSNTTADYSTWTDSYIRVSISQLSTFESFGVTHQTTGQLGSHKALPVSFTWTDPSTSSSFNQLKLVSADLAVVSGLQGEAYPCNGHSLGGRSQQNTASSTGSVSVSNVNKNITIDTRYLQTWTPSGGTTAASNWGHQLFAVCIAYASVEYDTGMRVTVSQIATLQYSSEYVGAPDRYMSTAELAINVFPAIANTKIKFLRDQGTNNSAIDPLPKNKGTHISFISTDVTSDPCSQPAIAGSGQGTCDSQHCMNTASATSDGTEYSEVQMNGANALVQGVGSFAVCYTGGGGSTTDYGWRDTYIRLKITALATFQAVSVTHRTFGQIPSVKLGEGMKFTWTGTLSGPSSFISLVDAGLNNNHPCNSHTATQSADATHSGPVQADASAGASSQQVTTLVTSTLTLFPSLSDSTVMDSMDETRYPTNAAEVTSKYYALCYSSDYVDTNSPGMWADSGIRLTTPLVTQVNMPSGYTGTPSRPFTSYQLPTNKIPGEPNSNFVLFYSAPNAVNPADALAANKYITLVSTQAAFISASNVGNPCVNPADAAHSASTEASGDSTTATQLYSGYGKNISQSASPFDSDSTFAVCYASGDGSVADTTWADTYIRLTVSQLEYFGTKGIRHRTDGMLPYHKAGLEFKTSTTVRWISLVDATVNQQLHSSGHFSGNFPQPCAMAIAGCSAGTNCPADSPSYPISSSHSGVHGFSAGGAGEGVATTISTLGLNTSIEYAVCYAGPTSVTSGEIDDITWADSAIRLTITHVRSIAYSGYSRKETEQRGKRWRTLTSTEPALQPAGGGMTDELVSNVLPITSATQYFVYEGDLAISKYISIAEWTDPDSGGSHVQVDSSNPCVNPVTATAFWNAQACISYDELYQGERCEYYTGALKAGNKEVTFEDADQLDSTKQYTFCYSSDGNSWFDSYIRFKPTVLSGLMLLQPTTPIEFFDHAHVGTYEAPVKLELGLRGAPADMWVALVDETLESNNPCESSTFWYGADPDLASGGVVTTTITASTTSAKYFGVGRRVSGQGTLGLTSVSGTPPVAEDIIKGNVTGAEVSVVSGAGVTWEVLDWNMNPSSLNALVEGEMVYKGTLPNPTWSGIITSTPSFPRGVITTANPDGTGTSTVLTLKSVYGPSFQKTDKLSSYDASPDCFISDVQKIEHHFDSDGATHGVHHPVNSPTAHKFVGTQVLTETWGADYRTALLATDTLDVTKQYQICVRGPTDSMWSNSGLRTTISKVHTLRSNSAQTPISNFQFDLTSSRSKVGAPRCLSIGSNPLSTCGPNLDATCTLGALCDPDLAPFDADQDGILQVGNNRNGGCGTFDGTSEGGQCASGLGPTTYVCHAVNNPSSTCDSTSEGTSFSDVCAAPTEISCSSDNDCRYHHLDAHCQTENSRQAICMLGNQVLPKVTRCNPDNANNGGCGATGGICAMYATYSGPTFYNSVRLNILPQSGTGSHSAQVLSHDIQQNLNPGQANSLKLLDSSLNNGEPCLLASMNGTAVTVSAVDGSVNLPLDDLVSLTTEYTICYNASGVGEGVFGTYGVEWFDSFIRVKMSPIDNVGHHNLNHYRQGHIPRASAFGLTYHGKLGHGAQINLVRDGMDCGASGTAGSAAANSKQVTLDTSGLTPLLNWGVCIDGHDTGIRVTVSTINELRYNYDQHSGSIGERVFERSMTSTNVAPTGCDSSSCAGDSDPASTNRIPVPGGTRTLEYWGSVATEVHEMFLVDSSLNNNNPCMGWDDLQNSNYPAGRATSAITASARRFSITQTLNSTVSSFTACSCIVRHGASTDFPTCRDTYVQMVPSEVQTITAYGQEHKTTGTLPSRAAIGLKVDSSLSASTQFPDSTNGKLALVEESINGYRPCSAAGTTSADPSWDATKYSGPSTETTSARTVTLKTDDLSPNHVFALCYSTDGGVNWRHSGQRFTTPKVQSISYSAPARVLTASSCFSDANPATPGGIADCIGTDTSSRNSQLPRSPQVSFSYGGHATDTTLGDDYLFRLAEHQLTSNDPCRTGATGGGPADQKLDSVVVTSSGKTVTLSLATDYLLDATKTFALCYSTGNDTTTTHTAWRDSFIRITMSPFNTLQVTGDSLDITTKGLIPAQPQMLIRWLSSSLSWTDGFNANLVQAWIRITSTDQNGGSPCHQSNADQAVGSNSTAKMQAAAGTEFVTMDTSMLGSNLGQNDFAVCTATGDGSTSDTTWLDSGIRMRAVRWANSAKTRVVSGAPSIMYFDLSTGDFLSSNGKVALVAYDSQGNATVGCDTAKDAVSTPLPYFSTGNAVTRQVDYRCKSIGSTPGSACDSGGVFHAMDESYTDKCTVNARCNPNVADPCGVGGECSAAIQLPTGKTYTGLRVTHVSGVWEDTPVTELALQAGKYSICVCDDLAGDGGCDSSNEWTQVLASNASLPHPLDSNTIYGGNLHVIARPRLGRDVSGTYGMGSVRHVQNRSHEFHIRVPNTLDLYGVQDGDEIYFAPTYLGCGQRSFWSGSPTEGWRTQDTTICTSIDTTNLQAACDVDNDGKYTETCQVGSKCKAWGDYNGGCGDTGVCGSTRVASPTASQTNPLSIGSFNGTTKTFSTPTSEFLNTVQTLTACFATRQSRLSNSLEDTELGDFAELDDTLEVAVSPQLGPGDRARYHVNQDSLLPTTGIRAIEATSPKFAVSTFSPGDLMYFMPRVNDDEDDCKPYMCATVGGSLISASACDADYDGVYGEPCAQWARCDHTNPNNGGCGTDGNCVRTIPPVNHHSFTAPAQGTDFLNNDGHISLPLDIPLTTEGALNNTACTPGMGGSTGGTFGDTPPCVPGSAKYLVSCFIPAGAVVKDTNVHKISEDLTILKEPTASLETAYHVGKIHHLDFTSPQQGNYNAPETKEFSTGLPGDCLVLTQASDCSQAYDSNPDSYFLGAQYDETTGLVTEQHRSLKMSLEEADKDSSVYGDVKGGVATFNALAQGKVNELPEGTYNLCYATMNSECDHPEDFSMLSKKIEILPASATGATLTVQMTVQLGHDMIVEWSSNKGLSPQDMMGESWVGLYDKDACIDTHPQTLRHNCRPEGGRQQPLAAVQLKTVRMMGGHCQTTADCLPEEWKSKCQSHHLHSSDHSCSNGEHQTMCYKGQCTGGIDHGVVRFKYDEYVRAGDYDVRMFTGDSRNRNGYMCGGMRSVPHEVYTQCVLESTVNATVKVYNNLENLEDLDSMPGLEVMFRGNRGVFNNPFNRLH